MLVQIDRLVALLETPCFTFLRLQLLRPRTHPSLLRAMYGLLALLPQSNAFRTLHTRLQSIPTIALMQLEDLSQRQAQGGAGSSGGEAAEAAAAAGPRSAAWADFDSLLDSFCAQQQKHFALEERAYEEDVEGAGGRGGHGHQGQGQGQLGPSQGGAPPDGAGPGHGPAAAGEGGERASVWGTSIAQTTPGQGPAGGAGGALPLNMPRLMRRSSGGSQGGEELDTAVEAAGDGKGGGRGRHSEGEGEKAAAI